MRIPLSVAAGMIAVGICSGASAHGPLRDTIIDFGNGDGAALAAGSDTIDASTIDCRPVQGCTLMVPIMVEIGAGDGEWGICPTVDGVAMSPGCPIQGIVQAGGSDTITGNGWSSATVTQGSHTVAAVLSIHHASTLHAWQVSYIFWPNPRQ